MIVHITDMNTFDYVDDIHVQFNWEAHEYVGKKMNVRFGIGTMYIGKEDINGASKEVWNPSGTLDEFDGQGEVTEVSDSVFSELVFGCALNRMGLKMAECWD